MSIEWEDVHLQVCKDDLYEGPGHRCISYKGVIYKPEQEKEQPDEMSANDMEHIVREIIFRIHQRNYGRFEPNVAREIAREVASRFSSHLRQEPSTGMYPCKDEQIAALHEVIREHERESQSDADIVMSISGWQATDTAPKDATQVLLYNHIAGTDTYAVGFWNSDKSFWQFDVKGRLYMPDPTHWMPLPQSPEQPRRG